MSPNRLKFPQFSWVLNRRSAKLGEPMYGWSYLRHDTNLKEERTQNESTTRSKQSPNSTSQYTTQCTEGKLNWGPFKCGLTYWFCVPWDPPPFGFFVQFYTFNPENTQSYWKLEKNTRKALRFWPLNSRKSNKTAARKTVSQVVLTRLKVPVSKRAANTMCYKPLHHSAKPE